MCTSKLKAGLIMIKAGSFFPGFFRMAGGAVSSFKLPLVGVIDLVAGSAGGIQSQEGTFQPFGMLVFEVNDLRVLDERHLVARAARGLPVTSKELKACFAVIKGKGIEFDRIKGFAEVLLMTGGTIFFFYRGMKSCIGFYACLEGLMAIQA